MSDQVPGNGSGMVPPSSEEAERAVLGAALFKPDDVVHVMRSKFRMDEEFFYFPPHREICRAIFGLVEDGKGVDIRTVEEWLRVRGKLEAAYGTEYIEGLLDAMPTAAHAEFYCEIVEDKHIRRGLIDRAKIVAEDAELSATPATEQAKIAPELLAEVYDGSSVEFKKDAIVSGMEKDVATRTARVLAGDKKALIGLPTGYDWLDDAMNGFQPGLYFIGARPSAGKTTMEGQIMERISMACGPVLRCTNDSNMETLMGRDASRRSGVSLPKVLSGHCGKTQRDRFFEALREVQKWPQDFIVGETNLRSLCSMIRTGKRRKGYVAVTIDYVQTLRTGNPRQDAIGNERMTLAAIRLKQLAFDLNIPVICLSQLSRECERENRPPRASDLRDGGELEQAADGIITLWKNKDIAEQPISLPEGGFGKKYAVLMDLVKYKNGFVSGQEMWLYGHYFRFDEASAGWMDRDQDGEA